MKLFTAVIVLFCIQSALLAQGACTSCGGDSIGFGFQPNILCDSGGVEGWICNTIVAAPPFFAYTTQDTAPGTYMIWDSLEPPSLMDSVANGDTSLPVGFATVPEQNCLTIVVPLWVCNYPVDSIQFQFCLSDSCNPDSISKSNISFTPSDSMNPIVGHGGFTFTRISPQCFKIGSITPVIDSFMPIPPIPVWEKMLTCYDQNFVFTICPVPPGCGSTAIRLTCVTYHGSSHWGTNVMNATDTIGIISEEHWSNLIMHSKKPPEPAQSLVVIYPNPARNTSFESIEYTAMEDGPITVSLFTADGKEISAQHSTAVKGEKTTYQLPIDGSYPDGMYICRIMQNHSIGSKTLALIR